jgi:DNA-3-methyladenine glycosylase I
MPPRDGLVRGADRRRRCWWGAGADDYRTYHDREWGRPVADDHRLFEKLVLEGFQSGLSWLTILRKREAFRRAFAGFDYTRVARYDARDVRRLLDDAAIVRHRGKIEAAIANAAAACGIVETHGSLAAYAWTFEAPRAGRRSTYAAVRARTTSTESTAMSADLRRRGWSFVGPTTVYAFMQAMGLVNDHVDGCFARRQCAADRRAFVVPVMEEGMVGIAS